MGKLNDDFMMMYITEVVAKQSHCQRLQVGALIVKEGRILSMGYNGTAPGLINCDAVFSDEDKLKENFSHDHHQWSDVHEQHAEQNAISWAAKNGISVCGATIYTKYSPCRHCTKVIIAGGIKRVVFLIEYDRDNMGLNLMRQAGITIDIINQKEYENFKTELKDKI